MHCGASVTELYGASVTELHGALAFHSTTFSHLAGTSNNIPSSFHLQYLPMELEAENSWGRG